MSDSDPGWVRVQVKTFTRWANRYLSERMLKVDDIRIDFADGVKLINLVELISAKSLGRYNKKPSMRIQKLENINKALMFLKDSGIKLVNVGPDDICEGNIKIILGLMWTVILRYQISSDGDGSGSPKSLLLAWVNKQIKPYKDEGVMEVRDFTKSWQDGKALAALTDSLQPGLINIRKLGDPVRDCDNAIQLAETNFDIPRMIDAVDIVNNPDEHSMMTYISYFREYVENDGARKAKEEAERRRLAEEEARRKAEAIARALKWTASGPGLERGWKGRWNEFVISNNSGDEAQVNELQVVCEAQDGSDKAMGVVTDHDMDASAVDAKYQPASVGNYLINVTLAGYPIAKSPYKVEVREAAVAGKCWAEGPGLVSARDDQPATFTVFCRDAQDRPVVGEDQMEVTIEDDHRHAVQPSINDNRDGSYTVQYHAKIPGDYTVMVQIDKKAIKDMPRRVHVASGRELDGLMQDINKLRNNLELDKREFTADELEDPNVEENLTKERDDLSDVEKVVREIQDLRKKLDMPKRVFTEEELTGPHALADRTAERDDLADRLAHKKKIDPILEEIQRLRKKMDLPPREFTEDEMYGPTSLADRTDERDHLKKILPLHDEIHDLRKKLAMPRRVFEEDELTGPRSYPDREAERDALLAQMGTKAKTDPLIAEIQRLRRGLDLPPRQFSEEELTGPHAYEDRLQERNDLRDVTDLVAQIQRLRKKMDLPAKKFTEEELTGPNAVADLTAERDHLDGMVPVHDEIHDLRRQLEMPRREFKEAELTEMPQSMPDRIQERDELRDMLKRKKACEPICAEIQKLRKEVDLPKREWTFDELTGPTAVEDRTKERDQLRKVVPIAEDIGDLRKQLEMPLRTYEEDELTGTTAVPDREKERDELQEMLEKKQLIDPLIAEIQKIRKEKLDLAPREFTEDELWGPTAVKDRRKELADLKTVVPLKDQIADLRKQLDMPRREYEDAELAGPTAIPDRTKERDELLDQLGEKMLIDPLIAEIQALRKKMELEPRVFTEDELSGPTAVRDRIKERDDLKAMVELFDEIQDLHKQLEYPRREFTEEELTGPTSNPDRTAERDDLLDRLSRKKITDPLCKEIQELRQVLEMSPREFTEEERTGPTAIDDRTEELDELKEMVDLVGQIQNFRKDVELAPAQYEDDQLTGKEAIADRRDERDTLHDVVPLAHEIEDLRRKLDQGPRDFQEDELTGTTAVADRTEERDDLLDQLANLKKCEPLCAQIQRLRKQMEMSPREFSQEEMTGPTAVEDRTQERDDLQTVLPVHDDIHRLRRKLEMDRREFDDDELYGPDAIPDRIAERDALVAQGDRKKELDPILAEINRLRRDLELAPREWTDDEINGPTAVEDRIAERDQLLGVTPLAGEIHKLRRQLDMPRREFDEDELTHPVNAIPDRTDERDELLGMLNKKKNLEPLMAEIQKMRKKMDLEPRDFTDEELEASTAQADLEDELAQLKEVHPLYDEIGRLRKKCEMPVREYEDEELTHPVNAVPDRTEERDALLERLDRKKELDPLLRAIQRMRRQLELPPREWTDEEINGPTAVEDRTKEHDDLKEIIPLESQIQRLRKQLEMGPREWEEEELTGETAVPDRIAERDALLDRLNTKKVVSPLVREIQRLRAQMDLPPREFTDEELFGPDAIEDLTIMRDELKEMVPIYSDIQRLHKKLDVPPRNFDEDELCARGVVEDRRNERDRLKEIPPLCTEIHALRKDLGMDRRVFDDDELVGPTNVEDRTEERDALLAKLDRLRALQPLIDELQGLRKQLDMDPRVFEDGELDADDADQMLMDEIDELKRLLNRRDEADALAAEIQDLRRQLDMPKRVFTEEELDSPDAVPKLTVERDDLLDELERRRAVGDLPEQINRLRKLLGMPPKKFPDPVPISMVPELIEERDDLQDECDRRRAVADDLLPKIEKLWKVLKVPQNERPDLSLGRDEIPSLKWIDTAEKEYERLLNLVKDTIKDDIAEQQARLNKLWDQLHVPQDARDRFYRNIPVLYSQEGLETLRDEADRLHAMLLSSAKLIKLILKRKKFIQKMMEFEVIASDPRRLFKNSVQLNKEEQFRRTAYPSLLELEDGIRQGLTEFEEETGEPFMWEGDYYLVTLEAEIEERPMDPGVFGVGQGKTARKELQKTKIATQKASAAKKSAASPKTRTPTRTSVKSSSSPSARGLPAGFKRK